MPQVDYSKIVIYKIQHQELDELLYVGSTTHFGNRKNQHKSRCYNHNGKLHDAKLYTTIRTNGGWDAFSMVIIKEFPCDNKRQAEAEEDKVTREMKASLNTLRPYVPTEEQIQNKKKNAKQYREQNSDKLKEQSKQYREQNSDKRKEQQRHYYLNNIDKFKDKKKEKTQSECGCIITKINLARHKLTIKHQTFINQQTDQ